MNRLRNNIVIRESVLGESQVDLRNWTDKKCFDIEYTLSSLTCKGLLLSFLLHPVVLPPERHLGSLSGPWSDGGILGTSVRSQESPGSLVLVEMGLCFWLTPCYWDDKKSTHYSHNTVASVPYIRQTIDFQT